LADDEKGPSRGVCQTGELARARERGADLFGQSLSPHPDEVEATPQKFGAGRPKGSRNRSSEDLARLIQQIGGHPVLALARVAAMSLAEIQGMLGCTRERAFEHWKAVCNDVAPYVASKQPLAVAVSGKVTSLSFTVPLGDGQALLGPDAVEAMFAAGRQRAAAEGFDVQMLPAPGAQSDDEENDANSGT
jgi:hypothetical protein